MFLTTVGMLGNHFKFDTKLLNVRSGPDFAFRSLIRDTLVLFENRNARRFRCFFRKTVDLIGEFQLASLGKGAPSGEVFQKLENAHQLRVSYPSDFFMPIAITDYDVSLTHIFVFKKYFSMVEGTKQL